jgi:hypothetical protein
MQSALIWTAIIGVTLFLFRRRHPEIPAPLFRRHAFFSWLLLILNHTAAKRLGWAAGHLGEIQNSLYKPMGLVPAELNLASWIVGSFAGVVAVFVAVSLANGSSRARRWAIALVPLVAALFAIEFFGNATNPPSLPLWGNLLMGLLAVAASGLPYALIWRFYRQPETIRRLFTS